MFCDTSAHAFLLNFYQEVFTLSTKAVEEEEEEEGEEVLQPKSCYL